LAFGPKFSSLDGGKVDADASRRQATGYVAGYSCSYAEHRYLSLRVSEQVLDALLAVNDAGLGPE
jgi:hypothetical protein